MSSTFPPPDFVRVQSSIDGIEVYAPAPPEAGPQQEIVQFVCPQCGGRTAYSVADGGLTCSYCGYHQAPEKPAVGKRADEHEFTVETLQRADRGWGDARKELACQNCGAVTSIAVESLAHTCPFCASNHVIQRQAAQDILRPRFLIPFKIDHAACQEIARKWLGSSWMTPRALQQAASLAPFTGIYLPFWTFDAVTTADWKAEVEHTVTETYHVKGERKTRTRTVWRWESGRAQLQIDDLLVPGTERVSELLLGRIDDFDLRDLCPYEPHYLAGFQAQGYDVALESAWEAGRQQMRERTRQACVDQASSSRIRNFSMSLDFSHETWRYILLPVYLATYRFQGRAYQVMVNGQTGAVSGQRPVDWNKVWLAIGALVAPGLLLALFGLLTVLLGGVGLAIGGVGFVLLVIGLILAVIIFQKAQAMDDI